MGFQQGLSGLNAASKNLDVIGPQHRQLRHRGLQGLARGICGNGGSAIGSAGGARPANGIGGTGMRLPSSSPRAISTSRATAGRSHQWLMAFAPAA